MKLFKKVCTKTFTKLFTKSFTYKILCLLTLLFIIGICDIINCKQIIEHIGADYASISNYTQQGAKIDPLDKVYDYIRSDEIGNMSTLISTQENKKKKRLTGEIADLEKKMKTTINKKQLEQLKQKLLDKQKTLQKTNALTINNSTTTQTTTPIPQCKKDPDNPEKFLVPNPSGNGHLTASTEQNAYCTKKFESAQAYEQQIMDTR
tara:strand:- start:84 stop:701 length:618 start_codon:yes stop_codon:yes gene_type:complete